jgi:glutathione S-transferase
MKLSFIYFDFPFWRAEVARIALFMGGVDFENRKISIEEFQRVKKDGYLDDGTIIPFHQFPCLVINGVSVVQTAGIARFCGKISGLYPRNNDVLAAEIDQFLDIATDLTVIIASAGKEESEDQKRIYREKLLEGELARKLTILDKAIKDDQDWILGTDIGLADIAIWRLMGWVSSGMLAGIPIDILKSYSNISRICVSVDEHPKIKEWVEKTYPQDYVRGNYLGK